jgi:hypothetical protein
MYYRQYSDKSVSEKLINVQNCVKLQLVLTQMLPSQYIDIYIRTRSFVQYYLLITGKMNFVVEHGSG